MLREYTEQHYLPALNQWRDLSSDGFKGACELANWRKEIQNKWSEVRVIDVEIADRAKLSFGDKLKVACKVKTGGLDPESIRVGISFGPIGKNSEIIDGQSTPLALVETKEGVCHYLGELTCGECGKFGIAVISYPFKEGLPSPFDLGLIAYG